MTRHGVECPSCGEQVAGMGDKPMLHYRKGTNEICDQQMPRCRACDEEADNVQDLASIRATGICRTCTMA